MSSKPVQIRVYPTYLEIDCEPMGQMSPTYNVHRFNSRNLTEYDFNPRIRRDIAVRKYVSYDMTKRCGRWPRNCLDALCESMTVCGCEYEIVHMPVPEGRPMGAHMRDWCEDRDHQIPVVKFLTESTNPIRPLSQQTGNGKTYCSIKANVLLDKVGLVITSGLVDQWQKAYLKFTDLNPEDIYILQGFKSIAYLVQSDFRPKLLIGSLQTLRAYCNGEEPYDILPSFSEFLEIMGVGVKIVDECHMNFHTNVMIDLQARVPVNIYLSATYLRSDAGGRRIFDMIFPKEDRFGEGDYKKYVNITFYGYDVGFVAEDKSIHTRKGYSHVLYEPKMINDRDTRTEFMRYVSIVVQQHFLNLRSPGQKMLILFSTVRAVEIMTEEIAKRYPELVVKEYIHESPDSHLGDGVDIIVSTPKSCGTGRDVANLRTVLNTVSYSSEILTKQILGRLRELPSGETPEMVDLYNRTIDSQVRHYNFRSTLYKVLGLKYQEFKI